MIGHDAMPKWPMNKKHVRAEACDGAWECVVGVNSYYGYWLRLDSHPYLELAFGELQVVISKAGHADQADVLSMAKNAEACGCMGVVAMHRGTRHECPESRSCPSDLFKGPCFRDADRIGSGIGSAASAQGVSGVGLQYIHMYMCT